MTLLDGTKGNFYQIIALHIEIKIMRRLEAMGIINGTKIELMNKRKNGALIIKVRGTRLALGKNIAAGVEIGEAEK